MQASGARIKISDRGDFMSGTTDRYFLSHLFTSTRTVGFDNMLAINI